MPLTKILQGDYTLSRSYYQIKLPIDLEPMIPNNDPVRLLNACVEGMDLSELYQTYTRVPKNLATPKQLFKIVAYAAMNGIYSSRKIEASCRQNINYMYLLEGKPAPDNATIARFISLHLSQCSKELMAESTWLLRRNGLISSEVVFIDGTKIEANANKYTFVWKKAVSKNQARMLSKVAELIAVCEEVYGIRVAYNDRVSLGTIKQLVLQLEKLCRKERVVLVSYDREHSFGFTSVENYQSLTEDNFENLYIRTKPGKERDVLNYLISNYPGNNYISASFQYYWNHSYNKSFILREILPFVSIFTLISALILLIGKWTQLQAEMSCIIDYAWYYLDVTQIRKVYFLSSGVLTIIALTVISAVNVFLLKFFYTYWIVLFASFFLAYTPSLCMVRMRLDKCGY